MKQKIAIPTKDKSLCAHFGHCEAFAIFEVADGKVTNQNFLVPPPHQPGVLPGWLASEGITHVIAGGMGQRAITLFNQQGIEVRVGVPLKPAAELIEDFLQDQLVTGINACDH